MTSLRTPRLILRTWREDDLAAAAQVFAEPQVWWYPHKRGLRLDETEAFLQRRLTEWDQQGWGHWALELAGRLIGYTGFALPTFLPEVMPVPEIGWRLHPSCWGQGLATEAARAALDHGFSALGFSEVVSIYQPENEASGRVMQRIGMTFDRDTRLPDSDVTLRVYRIKAPPGQGRQPSWLL
ncbi:MAG: GNAT family N-acetyltransferase [Mycobacteriales bacterium]